MITLYRFGDYMVDWNGAQNYRIVDRLTGREVATFTGDGIERIGKYQAAGEVQVVMETYWASQLVPPGTIVDTEVLRMGQDFEDQWIRGTVVVPVPRKGTP